MVLHRCLFEDAIEFLERQIVKHLDFEVQLSKSHPQVIAVGIGTVPCFQLQPGVKVLGKERGCVKKSNVSGDKKGKTLWN